MKEIIATTKAPQAIGPYSQAVRHKGLLFLSGQIPLDPKSGEVVGQSVEEQADRVLQNMQGVLEAAGLSLANVVKTTVFLKDLSVFPKMNDVYARYFGSNPPARSTVEVARLPRDVQVEIEAIAIDDKFPC
jgi:2-iminobutanoate/2-iminopropanoate deaminase